MDYIPKTGDIIFEDSDKTGPKVVKYLMRSPTIWQDIFRLITGKIKQSEYYHPAMVFNSSRSIEQQKVVQFDDLVDELKQKKIIIFRRKNMIRPEEEGELQHLSASELGQPWGYVNLFGKFGTWLTGIKLFGRYIKRPNEEVSALRVARWFYKVFGEKFGEKDYRDNTTQTMVTYCLNHPEKYEMVYKKG